ncbi:CHAP domain-containing protein [Nonomuraea sp. NPDC050536]|uniref:CHAP domain-containing protein n=1 Tax=Nonomuraea sp. NPDC050536 TaxID=3364366 RepID=UPI0037CA362E
MGSALVGVGAGTASASVSRSQIVSAADSQIGKSCSSEYDGIDCSEEWCAAFAVWAWQHGDVDTSSLGWTVTTFTDYGHNNRTWHDPTGYTPQPGDAMIFGSPAFPTEGAHVGLVESVDANGVITEVGGNQGGKVSRYSGTASELERKIEGPSPDNKFLGYVSPVGATNQTNLSSQVAAVGNDGLIYHEVRDGNGKWSGFQPVAGYGGAAHFAARSVAIAGTPDGSAQLIAVGNDGNAYHNVRYANGTWQGWASLGFAAAQVSIAAMPNGSAQVLAMAPDGTLYHNIRFAPSGNWQGFRALAGYEGAATFRAKSAAIAGMTDGSAQLIAVGNDGNAYHNVRYANGTWQGWRPLGVAASSVALAGMPAGDSAQFVIVGNDGGVYHNIRGADGTWQGWRPLGLTATRVAIAAISDGSAQVLAEAPNGTVYHNIRFTPSGNWQGFRALTGYEGATTFQGGAMSIGGFPY